MSTKINSYILSDRIIRKMKNMTKESDEQGRNLGLFLLKTRNGEIIEKRVLGQAENFVGFFTAQANEKEPIPDLNWSYDICRYSNLFHCIGAGGKISCYKKKSDAKIDCEKLRIMSLERLANVKNTEDTKKLIEEDKKISKDIINKYFDKIDIV